MTINIQLENHSLDFTLLIRACDEKTIGGEKKKKRNFGKAGNYGKSRKQCKAAAFENE